MGSRTAGSGGQAPALHFSLPRTTIGLEYGRFRRWRAAGEDFAEQCGQDSLARAVQELVYEFVNQGALQLYIRVFHKVVVEVAMECSCYRKVGP